MCSIGFHNCPSCQEEYKCDQPNSECPAFNHYDGPCHKCDYWEKELVRKDEERLEQDRWQRQNWINEHGWDYET